MTGTASIRVGFVSGVRHAGSYADLLRSDPRVSLVGASDESSVPDWIREDGIAMAKAADIEWIDELGELIGDALSELESVTMDIENARDSLQSIDGSTLATSETEDTA